MRCHPLLAPQLLIQGKALVVIINRLLKVTARHGNNAEVAISCGNGAFVVPEPAKVQNLAKGIFSGLQILENKLQLANGIDGRYIFRVEGMGPAIGGEGGLQIPVKG